MKDKPNDLLLLAAQVLALIMQIFVAIGAAALVLAIPVLVLARDLIEAEIATELGGAASGLPMMPAIALIAIALALLAMLFVFLGRLRAIIATVGEGDPFAPVNARRLNLMAWLLLAMQLLAIPASGFGLLLAKWADQFENQSITVDAGIDFTGILMVILLFILARVFKHGAAMREDLEGTV